MFLNPQYANYGYSRKVLIKVVMLPTLVLTKPGWIGDSRFRMEDVNILNPQS